MISELASFQRTYQLAPIVFQNGIAGEGSSVSIVDVLEAGRNPQSYDEYFANFKPLPGGTLANWGVAEYPLAALTVAANAVVQMPLNVSLLMQCPVKTAPGNTYVEKAAALQSMQKAVQSHILQGGWFDVLTPGYAYLGCLLLGIKDVTTADTKQVQLLYQWDFVQPLISQEQAQNAQTQYIKAISQGFPVSGTWNNTGVGG